MKLNMLLGTLLFATVNEEINKNLYRMIWNAMTLHPQNAMIFVDDSTFSHVLDENAMISRFLSINLETYKNFDRERLIKTIYELYHQDPN